MSLIPSTTIWQENACEVQNSRRKPQEPSIEGVQNTHDTVLALLSKLSSSRVDRESTWLKVGRSLFCLFHGSQTGLELWDMWSRSSSRYVPGQCAAAWMRDEFKLAIEDLTAEGAIEILYSCPDEDKQTAKVKDAPKKPKPSDYTEAYHALGYTFTTNDMNDRVYVNGSLMTDGIRSLIMTNLREYGYTNSSIFQDAHVAEGEEHRFHPIKDYLNGLVWEGQDHIGILAAYVTDDDDVFALLIRKWMIGAVSKVMNPTSTEQNPMLVLAGAQGLGKSVLVNWLGSPLPEYFIASAIYPDNKDFVINAASNFVWEVKELGSTIRRSDIEALKGFLDAPMLTVRPPYGRHEIKKYVTSSFIGTINPDGSGFINDPTGFRRFRICQLSRIDFRYKDVLDINQLWAQAVALYKSGETYKLAPQDETKVHEINERYVINDPISEYVLEHFDIDKDQKEWTTATSQILTVLKHRGVVSNQLDRTIQMRLSPVLLKLGCSTTKFRIEGHQVRGWRGIRPKEQ